MMRKSIGLSVAAAMFAAMAVPAQYGIVQERTAVTSTVRQRKGTGGYWLGHSWNYQRGPGWTVAQVKRMAKKRRNQQLHRKACRKGGA